MPNLEHLLREHRELLPVLAQRWGVKAGKRSEEDIIAALQIAMLDPARIESVYDSLEAKARGVIQSLVGAKPTKNQMIAAIFSAMNGQVRKLGAGGIEREKPHEKPTTTAELLYYWGLVGFTNLPGPGAVLTKVAYIPDDLAVLLPTHKTGYSAKALAKEFDDDEIEHHDDHDDDDSEDDQPDERPRQAAAPPPEPPAPVKATPKKAKPTPTAETPPPAAPIPEPVATESARLGRLSALDNPRPADTSLVDDFTTLLAFLQVTAAHAEIIPYSARLDEAARKQITPHLIVKDPARLDFALLIGVTAGMIEFHDSKAYCKRTEARRWLESPRGTQLQMLADAWLKSSEYVDLAHVPALTVEDNGYAGVPENARTEALNLITELVPMDAPWSTDEFIARVFEMQPYFQRAEFDGWYIRGADNKYLKGVENWDAIDGALLDFYLTGPLYWLGLVTIGDGAVQFNGYGRAFMNREAFPIRAEPDERPILESDGALKVGRGYSRFERFQLARFTSWVRPPANPSEPYVYRVDAAGIQRGAGQGIQTDQIDTFLKRVTGETLPQYVSGLLGNWRGGAQTSVTMERLLVLRTNSVEAMDAILKEPGLRRYLGARLGPTDVIVRADQWEALQKALGDSGVNVDVRL